MAIAITQKAHGKGFLAYDSGVSEGVIPNDLNGNAHLIIHVRDLLETTKTLAELDRVVEGIDKKITEKDSSASHRARQVLAAAARGYRDNAYEAMGVEKPATRSK